MAPRPPRSGLAVLAAVLLLSACANVRFTRDTETSGTFKSTGVAFTILSWDIPKRSIDIARENASDARLPNLRVTRERVFPYLGPFDFLLDILSVRFARIEGEWGFAPEGR